MLHVCDLATPPLPTSAFDREAPLEHILRACDSSEMPVAAVSIARGRHSGYHCMLLTWLPLQFSVVDVIIERSGTVGHIQRKGRRVLRVVVGPVSY